MPTSPSRADVWQVDLSPVRGHEQGQDRPGVVVSHDQLNHGPAGLVIVVPITSSARNIPLHVPIDPPEGGLSMRSYAMCEQVRCVSTDRLTRFRGTLSPRTMEEIEDKLRIVLNL